MAHQSSWPFVMRRLRRRAAAQGAVTPDETGTWLWTDDTPITWEDDTTIQLEAT